MTHFPKSSELGKSIVEIPKNYRPVFRFLVDCNNTYKEVYPTYKTISQITGINIRTVRRACKWLKNRGLILIDHRHRTSNIYRLSSDLFKKGIATLVKRFFNIFPIKRLPLALPLSLLLVTAVATKGAYAIENDIKILSSPYLSRSLINIIGFDVRARATRKRMSLGEILAVLKKRNSMELTQEMVAVINACKGLRQKGATPTDADCWQMLGWGTDVIEAVTATLKNANPKKPMGYFFYECKNTAAQMGIKPRWEITEHCRKYNIVVLKPEFFAEPVVLDRPTAGNTKPNTVVIQETKERQQRERIESEAVTKTYQDRQHKKLEDEFNALPLDEKIKRLKFQIGFMSQMDTAFKDGTPSDLGDARKGLEDRLASFLAEHAALAGIPTPPMPDTNDRIVRMPEKKIDDKKWFDRFGKPKEGKPMQSVGSILPVVDISKDLPSPKRNNLPHIDNDEGYEESTDFTYNQNEIWGDDV